ncbi:hypothetical protein QJQ45_021599 [Haematococcus lacustris]|nr:hypothetical protein QJQ45_021599 [Haematococcus lacustris]
MYQDTHGLWRLTGKDKVVVPNDSELRNHILQEMHDAVYSGHVDMNSTLERVSRVFWWNTMRADVRYYVSTCDACQRDKASTLKPSGMLNPLSIPDYRWESVSMDFVTKLPSGSHGLSKMVPFVPCREDLKARRFAQLFIDNVYKLHGMPAELISDRGSLFTSVFWREAAYANKARRDVEYKVGQKVLLSTKNLKLKPGKARKLIPRYVGPFEILLLVGAVAVKLDLPASMSLAPRKPPQAPLSSQGATQSAAQEPGPSTLPPIKCCKRAKAEQAAKLTGPTEGKGRGKGKAAKVKPTPQPGRWLSRYCNAALNMQRIGENKWRALELCWWPEQGALPAKGKEYPGLSYKRLRDKPPTAQQQQPAEAQ